MNSSFAILQKLKGQFFQTVANKADFHVAFAPFAFTLSSDDFYFLKNTTTSGAEARKYLHEQSEFAVIANSVLSKPNLWRIDSDSLLYNAYKRMLEAGRTVDPDALTADEQARLDKAKVVLFAPNGADSAKYKTYKTYAARAADIEKALIAHNAIRSSIADTDSAAVARWNLDLQTLDSQKKDLLIEWQAQGAKGSIESAKAAYDEVVLGKARFIEKWQDARNIKLGSPNLLTDEYGVEFLATTCIPNAICDVGAPVWKKVTLAKAELAQLTTTFTQEMPAAVLAEFGELQPELDAINFEYCLVDILRPWFDESVINNRLWKFADASLQVSAGDETMTGQVPAYPVKIMLAKNIDLVFTPSSTVNDDIKTRLKAGNRLFFGPLLLKTIPTNLADNKVTSLRVQQLSTPELAVITQVAVQSVGTPPVVNTANRLAMIELLNRRPQVEMRRNVEMKSLVPIKAAQPMPAALAAAAAAALATGSMLKATTSVMATPKLAINPGMFSPKPKVLTGVFAQTPPIFVQPAPAPTTAPPAPPATATVLGKVFSNTNQPLAVVEIQVMNMATAATQSVLSGDDGSYALRDIDAARYQFKVRKAGYIAQDKVIDLRGNSTQDFLLEVQPVPTESFQVIGVICKRLPKLPNPLPDASYI